MINYINGHWLSHADSKISINDGGFLLGDGLFETIRFDNGNLFCINKHLKRLLDSLKIIRINLDLIPSEIELLLKEIIFKNNLKSGLLRLMITRGNIEGPPWLYEGPAGIYITIRPFSTEPNHPVNVVFYPEKNYPIIRFSPALKSLNYIGNMLAKKDAEQEDAFEPIFYNNEGFITECAIRNIFFIKENRLITPSLELGILPGVMRETIIYISKKSKLFIEETKIDVNSINDMDEAFISSTGIGLLPCKWKNWNSDFYKTIELKKKLESLIHNEEYI